MKALLLSALSLVMVLPSCNGKHDEEKLPAVGKYVYVDDDEIVHCDGQCPKLINGKDRRGHDIYAKRMIDTAELVIVDLDNFRVCARCVNEEQYAHLLQVSSNNSVVEDSVAAPGDWF